MEPEEIKTLIESGLEGSHAEVTGDGRHFQAAVVCDAFAGKTMLEQHRLVYSVLRDRFDTDALHALSLKTYTPEQWQATKA